MIFKHFSKIAAAAVALGSIAIASSCSDTPNTPVDNGYIEVSKAKGVYTYEGTTENGDGNFILCFTTATIGESELTGPGDAYTFNIFSDADAGTTPVPANGTYTFDASNSRSKGTIASEESFFCTLASGAHEPSGQTNYKEASLTVVLSGSTLYAEATVTLQNDQKFKLPRKSFAYMAEPQEIVDLERNVDLTISRTMAQTKAGENTQLYTVYSYVSEADHDRFLLNLVGPALPTNAAPVIAAGTYTIGSATGEFTCLAGKNDNGSYSGSWYDNTTKAGELGLLASGTVTINVEPGQVYTIQIDAQTEAGYQVKGSYTGSIVFVTGDNVEPSTTLKSDHIINFSNVQKGRLIFHGDFFKIGKNLITIDLDPETGSSDGLAMYLLQPDGTSNVLKEGTYGASLNVEDFIFIPGMITGTTFEPTTFYVYDAQAKGTDVQAPLRAGTIKITKVDDNWSFEIDGYDDANHHITGYWEGPLVEEKL